MAMAIRSMLAAPLVLQRIQDGVLGELGILLDLLLLVGEPLVRVGDLAVHRGQFTVDLLACLWRHFGEFVRDLGAVDGGHRLPGGLLCVCSFC